MIGDAYEGYYAEQSGKPRRTSYTELDASVYFGRSWSTSLAALLKDAYLTLTDGAQLSLGDLHEFGGGYSFLDSDTTGTARYELSAALDLGQVESVTVGGETYPVK